MTITQIEVNIKKLVKSFSKETFIYNLLLSYGLPKSSITRLQKGNLNLSKNPNEIIWKKKLFYRIIDGEDLHLTITQMEEASAHNERFIIVTDFKTLLAIDTKTNDKLDIALTDLPKHFDFFLPWAGMEKAFHQDENPAYVKAAVKMAKLFDEIRKDNPSNSPEFIHNLNVFLSRLLFCFFAEDTNIFDEAQFTNSIASHTQEDGSDLNVYFDRLFEVLNTPKNKRKSLPDYLNAFPFVNGGLFKDKIHSPKFTKSSRHALINSGDQNWSAINPDIFGSMFQAVVSEDQRSNLGQHYTSVPNIMKVIKPLFLDDLYDNFNKNKNNPQKLIDLLNRLGKIKIFDPACGSGNFLIIAFKELRKLEIKIIHHLLELQQKASAFDPAEEQTSFIPKSQLSLAASFQVDLFSRIQLSQFYGIEIDDFAHEVAKLALWLAEHQMNTEFFVEFGEANPTLPLKEAGKIVCANAARIDWEKVCPKEKDDEIFILSNPPYLGARLQNEEQKNDLKFVFRNIIAANNLDYIACWFYKGFTFIKDSAFKFAFVSTNSICQGEQVSILWPLLLDANANIFFVYPSIKWSNSAKNNAGVTVSIIGISFSSISDKYIFRNDIAHKVKNINPFLIEGNNLFIIKRSRPISNLPNIAFGSMPNDGGHLLVTPEELISHNLGEKYYIRKAIGAKDFLHGIDRYCIWLLDENQIVERDCFLEERINLVRQYRLSSKRETTKLLSVHPFKFGEIRHKETNFILIPRHSSENREYIPIGYFSNKYIALDSTIVIYSAETYHLGICSARMHNVWVKTVSGRLEERIRYSTSLSYNTFPFPNISEQRKQELTQTTFRILEEREKHTDKTLAELYDPNKMPDGLREAHHQNDIAVERCYRSKPFESDEERLEYLFKLYEQMIEEKERDTLFAKEKKIPKRRKK